MHSLDIQPDERKSGDLMLKERRPSPQRLGLKILSAHHEATLEQVLLRLEYSTLVGPRRLHELEQVSETLIL